MGEYMSSNNDGPSVGWGLFFLIAGGALLSERLGWIPADVQWGFPAVLIAFGTGILFNYFRGK
jgi:hypothetical protein